MVNIGLVYTIEEEGNREALLPDPLSIHFGLAFIISSLQEAGYNPKLLVLAANSEMREEITKFIRENNLAIVGFTSVATQYPTCSQIARYIKELDPSIYTIVGGTHPILDKDRVIENRDWDAVCIGEGEKAIISYVQAIEKGDKPRRIYNLWIRDRGTGIVEKNTNTEFNPDLDSLPYIDRRIWEPWIASRPIVIQHILMARGCPFKCTYCSNHALAQTQEGSQLRWRSSEDIIGELEQIIADYPETESIYFEVETFGANLKYAEEFCNVLTEFNKTLKRPLKYGINLAVTRQIANNADILTGYLQKAGFSFLNIGLESGSPRMRKILRRPNYTNEDLVNFCASARKYGLRVNLYVLLGLPGETPTDFMQTVEVATACVPHGCSLSKYYPYPGTALHRVAEEQGLIDNNPDTILERRKTVMHMKDFPSWRIELEYLLFHFRVFKSQIPFIKRFLHLTRKAIYLSPWLNSMYVNFIHRTSLGRYIISLMARSQFE